MPRFMKYDLRHRHRWNTSHLSTLARSCEQGRDSTTGIAVSAQPVQHTHALGHALIGTQCSCSSNSLQMTTAWLQFLHSPLQHLLFALLLLLLLPPRTCSLMPKQVHSNKLLAKHAACEPLYW